MGDQITRHVRWLECAPKTNEWSVNDGQKKRFDKDDYINHCYRVDLVRAKSLSCLRKGLFVNFKGASK